MSMGIQLVNLEPGFQSRPLAGIIHTVIYEDMFVFLNGCFSIEVVSIDIGVSKFHDS